jgi:hypothetical protein
VAASLGEPLEADRWIVGLPLPGSAPAAQPVLRVGVLNPSSTDSVDVRLDLLEATGSRTVWEASLEPGRRADVDVAPGAATLALVGASAPVVVGRIFPLLEPAAPSAEPALPVAGTTLIPPTLG